MTAPLRVAIAEPLATMGVYFERLTADAGHIVWQEGDGPADTVLLSLDGQGRKWALLVEEWLASGATVIATAATADRFLVVADRNEDTQRLRRPFTPTTLREALETARQLRKNAATLARDGAELDSTEVQDGPAIHDDEPRVELTHSLQSSPKRTPVSRASEREPSIDAPPGNGIDAPIEVFEARLAEAIADAVPELARLESREARVATLRYLIQTA